MIPVPNKYTAQAQEQRVKNKMGNSQHDSHKPTCRAYIFYLCNSGPTILEVLVLK